MIGLNYERRFSKRSSVVIGLNFEPKGSDYVFDSLTYKLRFNYLVLPIIYRGYSRSENVKAFYDAGFFLGRLLTAKFSEINSGAGDDVFINLNDSKYNIHHYDFGIALGFGLEYRKDKYQFITGVRYNLGMVTVQPNDYYNTLGYYGFGSLNRSFNFYVTAAIDLQSIKREKNQVK